jgi:hypothetical protein
MAEAEWSAHGLFLTNIHHIVVVSAMLEKRSFRMQVSLLNITLACCLFFLSADHSPGCQLVGCFCGRQNPGMVVYFNFRVMKSS